MVDIFGPALIPDRFGAEAIKETDVEVAEAHEVVSGLELGELTSSPIGASLMKTSSPFHMI